MGKIFGNNRGRKPEDVDGDLLATCYRCGHKFCIKLMREVGYNVFVCEKCRTSSERLNGGERPARTQDR